MYRIFRKTGVDRSEEIQHIVEVQGFSHLELVFGARHIVKKEFEDQCASEAAALNLKLREAHRKVALLDVIEADKARVFHGERKAIAFRSMWRVAVMRRAREAEGNAAYGFVAGLPLRAAEIAAFICEKLDLCLRRIRKFGECFPGFIQAKIGHHVAEVRSREFLLEIIEMRQHLRGRGDEIEGRVLLLEIAGEEIGGDDDTVLWSAWVLRAVVRFVGW